MADKIFAAIDVGSFEIAMKIYEMSSKNGMKEIDHIRHHLALGYDSYNSGKITPAKIDELCRVLREYKDIMKTYQVTDYKAYGTSAMRETENTLIIQDQIKNRTGIWVDVLSNSEQRFLDYKSIASMGTEFHGIIEQGTAIVDIGGGNIQLSLFDNDTLVSTQNVKLGVLRLRETLNRMGVTPAKEADVLEEIIDSQMSVYKKIYMKDRDVRNLIVMDEYVSRITGTGLKKICKKGVISVPDFIQAAEMIASMNRDSISQEFEIPEENVEPLLISLAIIRYMSVMCTADSIWVPGVTICDGMAYEFVEKCKFKIIAHNFEKDILASAMNISKRYMGSRKRAETLEDISLEIFDAMKKVHGMGKRERFLLQLSAILHDCGKFINMNNVGECSYNIVMNTEMIGLSHQERQIVAYVVRFNHDRFVYYEELSKTDTLTRDAYLVIAKLTAILRIASGLDKSHKQKMRKMKAELNDERLILNFQGHDNIFYERESFNKKSAFFQEVYSIEPVIVYKKPE